MPRFFVENAAVERDIITITGEDASHITRSLRMKEGEELVVCDERQIVHTCTIASMDKRSVTLKINSQGQGRVTPYKARLFVALAKGERMDTIMQKATEFGVSEIVPVLTRRAISRPEPSKLASKLVRWQRIVREAAGQCGRCEVPIVGDMLSFDQALEQMQTSDLACICYENENSLHLREFLPHKLESVAFFTGPEGGFDPYEVAKAAEMGIKTVGLGQRILRCESAPLYFLSALDFRYG